MYSINNISDISHGFFICTHPYKYWAQIRYYIIHAHLFDMAEPVLEIRLDDDDDVNTVINYVLDSNSPLKVIP